MLNKISALVLLVIAPLLPLYAVDFSSVWYLGIEHGMSNNEVNCLYQDQKGFMWFGTFDGLNRYDGHQFKTFRKKINDPNSLVNNRIQSLVEDSSNNLWIATMGGISLYDPLANKFTSPVFYSYPDKKASQINNTLCLKRDSKGDIFMGTAKTGLLLFEKRTGKINQIPLKQAKSRLTSYQVSAIEVDSREQVWVMVEKIGLCKYDQNSGLLSLINPSLTALTCLQKDLAGNLWAGTNRGLYKYQSSSNNFVPKSSLPAIMNLHLDRAGTLWISTDGGGVFLMDSKTEEMVRPQAKGGKDVFTSAAIKAVLQDQDKRIWVATLRGGINVIDPERHRFRTTTPDLPEHNHNNYFISSLSEDADHNIWVGTDGFGIAHWNRKQNSFRTYTKRQNRGLKSNNITSVLTDYQNHTWVATWGGGIHRFKPSDGSFEAFSCVHPSAGTEFKNTWKLFEDTDRNLWAAPYDNGGLFRFNRGLNRFELFDSSMGNVLSLAEDSRTRLWAGTDNKLIKLDRVHKKHVVYHIGFRVRSILEHKEDMLWLATEGNGLLLFNVETGKFSQFTEDDGLPNNAVLNILRDNAGQLWLSTFSGLARFDPVRRRFESFYASDGLQSNQFSYASALKLRSGALIFGGIRGFNFFDPAKIRFSDRQQKVIMSNIRVDDIPLGDEESLRHARDKAGDAIRQITIPYDKGVLSLEYVSIEYSTPEKVRYAYKMEGWDRRWILAGRLRVANYSKLTEGKYVFRVKAVNSRGEWGEETLLNVRVLPPWWRSWWACSAYLAVMTALVYVYSQYKRKQRRLELEVRLAQIETEKEKELNEKKLSFFTNITHELRTPLTLIVNPVKELLQKAESPIRDDLNIVYRNASRLLTLVDQLMLFRTVDQDANRLQLAKLNLYKLCRNTFEFYVQVAKSRNIQYEFIAENTELEILGDHEKLETVIFNILSNAFKFTPANGRISLELTEKQNDIHITITDSGCGIEEEVKSRLFEKYYRGRENTGSKEIGFGIGLYLAKHFIDGHKGILDYTSSKGKGTSFLISLKKGEWTQSANQPLKARRILERRPEPIPQEEGIDVPFTSPFEITRKKSLLIVDDDAELRRYLKKMFAEKFVVFESEDAIQGFRQAQDQMPDIVISDILMNGTDGVDLCEKMKSDATLNHIPVILLSGMSSSDSRLKGIEIGADDYITKPFDLELLAAKVDALLKNRDMLHQYFRDSITFTENNQKISAEYKAFLEKCVAVVEENLNNENFNARMLAESCNMGYSNFYKKVKTISGQSVSAFIRSIRLRRAAVLMLSTDTNINEAAYHAGIYDIKYFRIQFKKLYGINPSEYIKKYRHSFSKEFNLIKKF